MQALGSFKKKFDRLASNVRLANSDERVVGADAQLIKDKDQSSSIT